LERKVVLGFENEDQGDIQIIVIKWRPFTMLVNERLPYILIDSSHYSSRSQVILTISLLSNASLLTDQELHLATDTEQDRTRLSLLQ
jgi:hypothetical protein